MLKNGNAVSILAPKKNLTT